MLVTRLPALAINDLSVLKGNGDGTFAAPVVVLSSYLISSILTDDFNQDGKADLNADRQ